MITFNKAYQEAISKYGKDDIRSVAHFMFQKGIESALKPIDDLKPGDKVVLRDIEEMRLIRGNTDIMLEYAGHTVTVESISDTTFRFRDGIYTIQLQKSDILKKVE